MSTLSVAAQQFYISLQAYLGLPDYSHQTIIDYVAPSTLTAAVQGGTIITVPTSTTDQAVNLATYNPAVSACLFISIQDVTNPGQPFSFGTATGTGRIQVPASGFVALMVNGTSLPTIYLTNPSASVASEILVSIASN